MDSVVGSYMFMWSEKINGMWINTNNKYYNLLPQMFQGICYLKILCELVWVFLRVTTINKENEFYKYTVNINKGSIYINMLWQY